MLEATRIHYDFCREHSKIGKIPAEEAGIHLGTKADKIEFLIRAAGSSVTRQK